MKMETERINAMVDSLVASEMERERIANTADLYSGPFDGRPVPGVENYGLGKDLKKLIEEIKQKWKDTIPVVCASTGLGKSTLIPYYLNHGRILVIVPFRQAALNLIRWANENKLPGFGVAISGIVKNVDNCRILVATAGYVVQREDLLKSVDCFVFDEMHVWNYDMQHLVEYVDKNNLTAVGLSATFSGKQYKIKNRKFSLIDKVATPYKVTESLVHPKDPLGWVVNYITKNQHKNILVFCPGEGTIDKIVARTTDVTVHKFMSGINGNTIPGIGMKAEKSFCIAATNALETAITVRGLDVVIDLGQEKVPEWDGYIQSLPTRYITEKSSIQRRGRVGRTKPGEYYLVVPRNFKFADETSRTWSWEQDVSEADVRVRLGIGNPSNEALDWYSQKRKFINSRFPTSVLNNTFINEMDEKGCGLSALAYVQSLEQKISLHFSMLKNTALALPGASFLSNRAELTFEDIFGFFGNKVESGLGPRGEKIECADGAFHTLFRKDNGKLEPIGYIPGKVNVTETDNVAFWIFLLLAILFYSASNLFGYVIAIFGFVVGMKFQSPVLLAPIVVYQVLGRVPAATLMSSRIDIDWGLTSQIVGFLGIFIPVFSYTFAFKKGMSDSTIWSFVTRKTYEQAKAFLAGFPSERLMKMTFPPILYKFFLVLVATGILVTFLNKAHLVWEAFKFFEVIFDIPPILVYSIVLWSILGWYFYVKGYNDGIDNGIRMMANAEFDKNVTKYSASFTRLVEQLSWQGILVLVFMITFCVCLSTMVTSVKQMSAVQHDQWEKVLEDVSPVIWCFGTMLMLMTFVRFRFGKDEDLVWKAIRSLSGNCRCGDCELCTMKTYDDYLGYVDHHTDVLYTVGFPGDQVIERVEDCKAYCLTQLDILAAKKRKEVKTYSAKLSKYKSAIEYLSKDKIPELLKLGLPINSHLALLGLCFPGNHMRMARELSSYVDSTDYDFDELPDEAPEEADFQNVADGYVLESIKRKEHLENLQQNWIPTWTLEIRRLEAKEKDVRKHNREIELLLDHIVDLKKLEGFGRDKYTQILDFLDDQGVDVSGKPDMAVIPCLVSLPDYGSSAKFIGLGLLSFLGFWSLFSFACKPGPILLSIFFSIIVTIVRNIYSSYRLEIAFGTVKDLNVQTLFARGFVVYAGRVKAPLLTKSALVPPLMRVNDVAIWLEIIISVVLLMWYSGVRLYGVEGIDGIGGALFDFLPYLVERTMLVPVSTVAVPDILRKLATLTKDPEFFTDSNKLVRISLAKECVNLAIKGETLAGFNSIFTGLSPNDAWNSLDDNVECKPGVEYDVPLGDNAEKIARYPGHVSSKPGIGCINPAFEFLQREGYNLEKYKDVMYTTTGNAEDNRYAYRYRRGQRLVPFSCLDYTKLVVSAYQVLTFHNPAKDGLRWKLGNPMSMPYKNKAAVGLRLRKDFKGKTKEYMNSSKGLADLMDVYERILLSERVNIHWCASNKVENKEVKKKIDSSMEKVCKDYTPLNNNFVRIFTFTDRAINQIGATVFDPFFETFKKRHCAYGVAVGTPIVGDCSWEEGDRPSWYDVNKPLSVNVKYLFASDQNVPYKHVVLSEDVKHWDGSQSAGKLLLMSIFCFMNYDYSSEEEFLKVYKIWATYTRERIFSVMVLMDGTVVQEHNCQNSGDIFTTGSNTLGNLFDNMYLNHNLFMNRYGEYGLETKAFKTPRQHKLLTFNEEFAWEESVAFSRLFRLYGAGDNFLVAFPEIKGRKHLFELRADEAVLEKLNRHIKEGEGGFYHSWRGCEFFSQVLSSFGDRESGVGFAVLNTPIEKLFAKGWHLKKPVRYHKEKLHFESQMKLAGFLISYMFLSVPRINLFNMFQKALHSLCPDVLNLPAVDLLDDDYWSEQKFEALKKYKVGEVTLESMFYIRFGSKVIPGPDDISPM